MVKETYGFKSKHHPVQCKELETFEKDLYNIVSSLKYRKSTDDFQEQMKEDISSINYSPDVFILKIRLIIYTKHDQNNIKNF